MRADAEAFAKLVRAAGGHCDERMWPGLMHGYWLWPRDNGAGQLDDGRCVSCAAVAEADTAS